MEIFQSSDELWEKVLQKFYKTMKSFDEDVTLLDEWLKNQPHLPQNDLNRNCLRNFLVLNKFSLEVAKQKIDNYFTLRVKFQEVYGKCHPKLEFNEVLNKTLFLVLSSKLTKEMYRVYYFKFKNEDLVDFYEPLSEIKRLMTIQDLRLRTDVMLGEVAVIDFKGLSLSALLKVTPLLVYRTVKLYEKIYSIPLKEVYIINLPSFGATLLLLFKKAMKPKLFERIHVIKDAEAIKKLLPLDLLSKDFGGEGPSLADLEEALYKLDDHHSELFSILDEMTINETLRPEKVDEEIFGIYGNFKKLDVD